MSNIIIDSPEKCELSHPTFQLTQGHWNWHRSKRLPTTSF